MPSGPGDTVPGDAGWALLRLHPADEKLPVAAGQAPPSEEPVKRRRRAHARVCGAGGKFERDGFAGISLSGCLRVPPWSMGSFLSLASPGQAGAVSFSSSLCLAVALHVW